MDNTQQQATGLQHLMTRICMARDIGIHGNLFGGTMLAWLDEAAAALASQACDTPHVVTVSLDKVVFERPVRVGQLIKIYGAVEQVGRTSITLRMEARKHNVRTGRQKIVCQTHIVFVTIDEEGEPTEIPSNVREKFRPKSPFPSALSTKMKPSVSG